MKKGASKKNKDKATSELYNALKGNEIDREVMVNKLGEIDKTKNKESIESLKQHYADYQKILGLKEKDMISEDELTFLYKMAYSNRYRSIKNLSLSILEKRDINKDYNSFSFKGKVELFLNIQDSIVARKLKIEEKEVMTTLAQKGCISQLKSASEDIINDRNYIVDLLETFIKSNSINNYKSKLYKNLPDKYRTDVKILELLLYKYTPLVVFNYLKLKNGWLEKKFTKSTICI